MTVCRRARREEIDAIVELGGRFHKENVSSPFTFDPAYARALVSNLIESPLGIVLVVESDGHVLGFLIGGMQNHLLFPQVYAFEIALYVDRASRGAIHWRRLVREYERIAKRSGCVVCTLSSIDDLGGEDLSKMFERMGYRRMESGFGRTLN